ncbi:metal ABC transporter ATP-binding protein [Umezawaea endophytica]|uniref:ABC transporter ATP-binding protein n=1 Tax=Umezawaea endophytica TaxID=1654476 RepID=A0A9X2VLN8_9PSEU|nr:ABC transporter ATP-binding protein [Umezawaea endophytica]MCS7478796.1 ABC transporter ATP-binding protein [Umezawaea endophytica]
MTTAPSTTTDVTPADRPAQPRGAVSLRGAALAYGRRVLWNGLDLEVQPGEFLAVLGPNGSGKTSLMRVLLGLQPLSGGSVEVAGRPPGRGNREIGYIPQQRSLDPTLTLRGRDLVGLGLDGHAWGLGLRGRKDRKARVDEVLAAVGATDYADAPIGLLSGGEQQRLRVAQALVGDPRVLLCDEPLLSLDLAHQRVVSDLIDTRRKAADTAVLFVTHEINPVLPLVDRVLYLVDGRFRIGPPSEVMTSETLSELYGTTVDVVRVRDQVLVVGATGKLCEDQPHHVVQES